MLSEEKAKQVISGSNTKRNGGHHNRRIKGGQRHPLNNKDEDSERDPTNLLMEPSSDHQKKKSSYNASSTSSSKGNATRWNNHQTPVSGPSSVQISRELMMLIHRNLQQESPSSAETATSESVMPSTTAMAAIAALGSASVDTVSCISSDTQSSTYSSIAPSIPASSNVVIVDEVKSVVTEVTHHTNHSAVTAQIRNKENKTNPSILHADNQCCDETTINTTTSSMVTERVMNTVCVVNNTTTDGDLLSKPIDAPIMEEPINSSTATNNHQCTPIEPEAREADLVNCCTSITSPVAVACYAGASSGLVTSKRAEVSTIRSSANHHHATLSHGARQTSLTATGAPSLGVGSGSPRSRHSSGVDDQSYSIVSSAEEGQRHHLKSPPLSPKFEGKWCVSCASQEATHKREIYGPFGIWHYWRPQTVQGLVYKGYCLHCYDVPKLRLLLKDSTIPSSLIRHNPATNSLSSRGIFLTEDTAEEDMLEEALFTVPVSKHSPVGLCCVSWLLLFIIFAACIGGGLVFSGNNDLSPINVISNSPSALPPISTSPTAGF